MLVLVAEPIKQNQWIMLWSALYLLSRAIKRLHLLKELSNLWWQLRSDSPDCVFVLPRVLDDWKLQGSWLGWRIRYSLGAYVNEII